MPSKVRAEGERGHGKDSDPILRGWEGRAGKLANILV